jgi:hypothetical protein
MSHPDIQAKAIIAAALIQSRAIDAGPLASMNKDISSHKLAHLRELTDRIYNALAGESPDGGPPEPPDRA